MRAYVPFQLVVACFLAAIACSDDDEATSPPLRLGTTQRILPDASRLPARPGLRQRDLLGRPLRCRTDW